MNHIFHAHITWYHYFLLTVLTVNAVGALWIRASILALIFVILIVFIIEWIIHTTYTVTSDGMLVISRGRFSRKLSIPLSDINAIEKCHSMKFARFSVTSYILITYNKEKFVTVVPIKEQEFVELIKKGGGAKDNSHLI